MIPACNAMTEGRPAAAAAAAECQTVGFTSSAVTCSCAIDAFYRRRMLATTNGTLSAVYTARYVAMLHSTMSTFEATITSAEALSAGRVENGWKVATTMGTLASMALLLCWAAYAGDRWERRQTFAKVKPNTKMPLKRIRNMLSKSSRRPSNTLEESLPPVFLQNQSIAAKIRAELKRHHRWFAVIFHYSETFPRLIRVASLLTNIVIMLFIQSLTYNLTNTDESACRHYVTESACLAPRSPFATPLCHWAAQNSTSSASGCALIYPDNSWDVLMFVAVFTTVISIPFALGTDHLFKCYIAV